MVVHILVWLFVRLLHMYDFSNCLKCTLVLAKWSESNTDFYHLHFHRMDQVRLLHNHTVRGPIYSCGIWNVCASIKLPAIEEVCIMEKHRKCMFWLGALEITKIATIYFDKLFYDIRMALSLSFALLRTSRSKPEATSSNIPIYCLRMYCLQCMHNINLPIKLNARMAIAFIVAAMVSKTGAQCATRMLLQAPSHFRMLQR